MVDHSLLDNAQPKNKIPTRAKYAFTIFALLDLVSFLRGFDLLETLLYVNLNLNFILVIKIIMTISFLASAVLYLLRKKQAFVLYYVQLPLRLIFMALSFGFVFEILGLDTKTGLYLVMLCLTIVLELVRFAYTVILHRKM